MYKSPNNLYSNYCIGPTFGSLLYKLMISNYFKNVLEIGCLHGYSTHSFVSALKDGAKFEFTVCDIKIQKTVREIIKDQNVIVKETMSQKVINENYDFIFVDGDHNLSTVSEELFKILKADTKNILAHDTFINHPNFKGSVFLREVLSNHRKYREISFNKKIKNDQTHYGMSFFTQDDDIFDFASKLFSEIEYPTDILFF